MAIQLSNAAVTNRGRYFLDGQIRFDQQSMGCQRALAVEVCEETEAGMEFQQTSYMRRRQSDLARHLVQVKRMISVSILDSA